jgi:hypothetical protein
MKEWEVMEQRMGDVLEQQDYFMEVNHKLKEESEYW